MLEEEALTGGDDGVSDILWFRDGKGDQKEQRKEYIGKEIHCG